MSYFYTEMWRQIFLKGVIYPFFPNMHNINAVSEHSNAQRKKKQKSNEDEKKSVPQILVM